MFSWYTNQRPSNCSNDVLKSYKGKSGPFCFQGYSWTESSLSWKGTSLLLSNSSQNAPRLEAPRLLETDCTPLRPLTMPNGSVVQVPTLLGIDDLYKQNDDLVAPWFGWDGETETIQSSVTVSQARPGTNLTVGGGRFILVNHTMSIGGSRRPKRGDRLTMNGTTYFVKNYTFPSDGSGVGQLELTGLYQCNSSLDR